jgi:hypothetical protein
LPSTNLNEHVPKIADVTAGHRSSLHFTFAAVRFPFFFLYGAQVSFIHHAFCESNEAQLALTLFPRSISIDVCAGTHRCASVCSNSTRTVPKKLHFP